MIIRIDYTNGKVIYQGNHSAIIKAYEQKTIVKLHYALISQMGVAVNRLYNQTFIKRGL